MSHLTGHLISHTAKHVMEEHKQGKKKSAAGIGMMGLSVLLLPILGPFALIPFFMGITACFCQEKVEPKASH